MTTLDQQWADLYRAGKVRWMAGMMDACETRVLYVKDDGRLITSDIVDTGAAFNTWREHDVVTPNSMDRPDWSDPATIGCLLHQAREAWGDPGLTIAGEYCPPFDPSWRVTGQSHHGGTFQRLAMIGHPTEPAAILAAIAAAPPRSKP